MGYTGVLTLTIALLTTACTETADETADDDIPRDSAAMIDADSVGTDVRSPADADATPTGQDARSPDTPPASDGADPTDTPTPDPVDDSGGDVATSIPSSFRGEWNADLEACGTGSSVTRLRISADQMRFYESVGAVREVVIESNRVITVTAEYQGEGDTWQDERRLSLSENGNSLTVSNGTELVRNRCP